MEEILQLLGTKPFCFLCRQIFLRQLPTVVRTQLAEANFSSDPRAVASQATMLWCTARLDNQLVGKTSGITSPNNELCTITKPNTLSTAPTIHKNWCQFHRRFGKAARKCQKPCIFPGNATAGHQSHQTRWSATQSFFMHQTFRPVIISSLTRVLKLAFFQLFLPTA